MFNNRLGINRRAAIAIGLTSAVGLVALAGCSSSPTPTPTTTNSSASASPTSSTITIYKVSGATATVAGTKLPASSGKMIVDTAKGSGTGFGAASINVEVGSGPQNAPSSWVLHLVTNGNGQVESGSLLGPATDGATAYKVTEPSGKIAFVTNGSSMTLTTETPIKVQRGTETPTTLTVNIPGIGQ